MYENKSSKNKDIDLSSTHYLSYNSKIKELGSSFQNFAKRNNSKQNIIESLKTFTMDEWKYKRQVSKENPGPTHYRTEVLKDQIEMKELQCLKAFEDGIKNNIDFEDKIKSYNKDLYEIFLEIKEYPNTPIELIHSIISTLK